jgi:hypothetical protein
MAIKLIKKAVPHTQAMFFFKELAQKLLRVRTSDLPCYHSINFEMKNSLTSMFHSPDSVLLINVDSNRHTVCKHRINLCKFESIQI